MESIQIHGQGNESWSSVNEHSDPLCLLRFSFYSKKYCCHNEVTQSNYVNWTCDPINASELKNKLKIYLSFIHLITDQSLIPFKGKRELFSVDDLRKVCPNEKKSCEPLPSKIKDVFESLIGDLVVGDNRVNEESCVN